ncbi:MAG: 4Fe-4S binding protein [DPANN group archaeon]|nr:4Fe-4S binding protein [DPANN group archaeon]
MAVKIELENCMQCYACENVCPNNTISESDKGPVVDEKKCTDCGACKDICPASCII